MKYQIISRSDGAWLEFTTNAGRQCLLKLEGLAEKQGHLIGAILAEWCADFRVSPKAAEAPGGQRADGCSCGSHDLAPLYHHPKCALAPAAPSERADADVSSPAFYARRGPHCPTCGSFKDMPPNVCADPFHATPSRSEERERFEEWVKKDGFPDADLSQCGCADQMRFHYQDAYTDFAYRAWQGGK